MSTTDAFETDDDWLVVNRTIRIPRSEFSFTFVRSSGPGGQNVNKVASKAILRWPVAATESLDAGVKQRFLDQYGKRITVEGDLLITSQRFRDRLKNIDDCLDKLGQMIDSVARPPVRRKKVKPTRASRERRLRQKRDRSTRKESRRRPKFDE
jgi:ribosome-associated protein